MNLKQEKRGKEGEGDFSRWGKRVPPGRHTGREKVSWRELLASERGKITSHRSKGGKKKKPIKKTVNDPRQKEKVTVNFSESEQLNGEKEPETSMGEEGL